MSANHIPKNITPKGYQVLTAFCSPDYRHYGPRYYGGFWEPGMTESDGQTFLPNVPMRASATLLAERLRTGKHISGIRVKSDRRFIDPLAISGSARDKARFNRAKQAKLGQLIGVEIEFYPKRNKYGDPAEHVVENSLCNVCSDGSLNDGGREIRRITWADAQGRLAGLLALNIVGKVDKSCGLHVHIDARHVATSELEFSPVETYERCTEFYKHLKYLVPKSRRRNRYCKWKNNCFSSAKCRENSRYAAINWHSFEEHGTFEFRCQGGTINTLKIESWALLCQWIVNYSKVRANVIPTTWKKFVAALPEPLRSWAILRREKLYGTPLVLNERTMSAVND